MRPASTVRDVREVVTAELSDMQRVPHAGRIKSEFPLGFADAFAAAVAQAHDAELSTGDPELVVNGAPWAWRDLR